MKNLFLLGLLFCACAPSISKIKSELAQRGADNNVCEGKYLEAPFIAQKEFSCGPASLAMVLNYYGCLISQEEIAKNFSSDQLLGSFSLDLIAEAKALGFSVEFGAGNLEKIKQSLEQNKPAIVFWNYLLEPLPARHFAVVVGYFETHNQTYLIIHSGAKPNQVFSQKNFLKLWARENNWMMTIKPDNPTCP